jgi:hypothetical protein
VLWDLVRAREAAEQDQLRMQHRLSKFLLRTGQRPVHGIMAWTQSHVMWVQQIHLRKWRRRRRSWIICMKSSIGGARNAAGAGHRGDD